MTNHGTVTNTTSHTATTFCVLSVITTLLTPTLWLQRVCSSTKYIRYDQVNKNGEAPVPAITLGKGGPSIGLLGCGRRWIFPSRRKFAVDVVQLRRQDQETVSIRPTASTAIHITLSMGTGDEYLLISQLSDHRDCPISSTTTAMDVTSSTAVAGRLFAIAAKATCVRFQDQNTTVAKPFRKATK